MSQFVSYSANFEDVLLHRCFRDVEQGFYVDIGAHHPTSASVTRSFYDLGWSGVNVEPGDEIELLRAERQRDVNLELAVADFEGETTFFVHSGCTATSCLSEVVSPLVSERAGEIKQKTVTVSTLKSIIDQHAAGRHIHFLKIDAEGAEDAIVRGADWSCHRPEVLVIESTEPFTNNRRKEPWQDLLQESAYILAYFDGLNDFWVRRESEHLLDHFKLPVNVLDDFRVMNPELAYWCQLCGQQADELAAAQTKIADLSRRRVARQKGAALSSSTKEPCDQDVSARPKVLYFTCVYLGREDSGGMLVCREHVRLLASLKDIDLTVFTIGPNVQRDFVGSFGVTHINLDYIPPRSALAPNSRSFRAEERWPFLFELVARQQPQVEKSLERLIDNIRPDVVIIDYVLSAVWAPSVYRLPVRRITITLNREADFHHLARRLGRLPSDVSTSRIAEWRLRRFENWIYRNSDAVVALSPGDLPTNLRPDAEGVVIEPILEAHDARWRYRASKRLFFVGNFAHFPNYEAIKWLATKLAPELEKRDPAARIVIIGASENDVPLEWLKPNIDFRGFASRDEVRGCFLTSDLFIVPIVNDFGSKIKVLECMAYGTPLMATKTSLSGIPFPDLVPQFRLHNPEDAARLALELMSDGKRLAELAERLGTEMRATRNASLRSWRDLIGRAVSRPVKQPRRGGRLSAFLERLRRRLIQDAPGRLSKEVEVAVTPRHGVEVTGAYPTETVGKRFLRWTNGSASIWVLLDPSQPPRAINVKLWGIAPQDGTQVCISANDVEIFHGCVNGQPVIQELELPNLARTESLLIRIQSSVFQPEGDPRRLGVAIESMTLMS